MDCVTSSLHMQEKVEPHWLPPGFRFHPTDEELIYYLRKKIVNANFSVRAILEVDLNKCEPWDLPARSKMGEKEWYFFTLRDRKYPTGMRTNRATEAGYWKGTGKDREVFSSSLTALVGMKKTLVFYKGRAPKGEKTNWIIHEYRLEGDFTSLQLPHSRISKDSEWVVCRIFHKMAGGRKAVLKDILKTNFNMTVCEDQLFLPPLHECPLLTRVTNDPGIDIDRGLQSDQISSFTSENDALSALSSFMSDNDTLSALSSMEAKNSGQWTGVGDTCSDVADDSPLFETASGTFDVPPSMLKYPSYLDLQPMNLKGRELTVLSNTITKRKRETGLQSFPLLTKSRMSWHEPKQHVKDAAVDFLVDRDALATPCKIEPYMEVDETLQSGYRMLEKNVWMEGGGDFECSQSLLNLSLPFESSLFEINEEMSPLMYRNGISSTEDLDCFWTH